MFKNVIYPEVALLVAAELFQYAGFFVLIFKLVLSETVVAGIINQLVNYR